KALGRDVVGLGAGEPDFDTPEHIKQAAIEAMRAGDTKYTPVDGTVALKRAIIEKFHKDNGLDYALDQILVSCGGKQSFYNLCQAMLDAGDEVIIPAPYWVSYPDMALLADATPVIISTSQAQGFKITPEQLRETLTPRTRLMVLNSPSNPTGAAYTAAELEALADVLMSRPDVIVATDDMYEHIMFEGQVFNNILNVCPDLHDRAIVLNGVSKAYAMTGWRIGYAGGPRSLIKAMTNVQSQSTSNPCSIAQAAAAAALAGDQACVEAMRVAFEKRHQYVVAALNKINGVSCLPSAGTFYCFPSVHSVIERMPDIEDDIALAAHLLDKGGVALVPGAAFGGQGHVRISFATDMATLEKAITRIAAAFSQ
ncbi:MAG: pyridoxal phosphate-dependent aminotransferase, partial [Gammaproteobacteria bacterium]|nr:pyridoxal phosphate-dependent aminotransferase [Gammaproteobacteria bacterium]